LSRGIVGFGWVFGKKELPPRGVNCKRVEKEKESKTVQDVQRRGNEHRVFSRKNGRENKEKTHSVNRRSTGQDLIPKEKRADRGKSTRVYGAYQGNRLL